jgi:hypothetical protein
MLFGAREIDMASELRSHAVRELYQPASVTNVHVEAIRNIGYAAVESGLTSSELEMIQ